MSSTIQESARDFDAGYALSPEDWASPVQTAIRKLQLAVEATSKVRFNEALDEMVAAGVDLNKFVIQDTPRSWFNLAPFFLSKGTQVALGYLDELINRPDVDLNQQKALVFNRRAVKVKGEYPPESITLKPFSHVFFSGWSEYFVNADSLSQDFKKNRAKRCLQFMARFDELGLDWKQVDSRGNSIAHELFAYSTGSQCKAIMPWLVSLDFDVLAVNHEGKSAIDVANERQARETEKMRHSSGQFLMADYQDYAEALTLFQGRQMLDITPPAAKAFRTTSRL